jgi:hypothetical protein
MILSIFNQNKQRVSIVAATLCAALLAGCIGEDLAGTGSSSGGSSSGASSAAASFSPRSPQVTNCPSACLNVDVTTTRGIPASCTAACPEVQTASQCVAAGGAYDVYLRNGRAGADAGTLAQLYTQYSQQASLANQVVSRIGCGRR